MRRIAVINQKGGVGKTTTTANLGAALAQQGRRVVVVDMDAQANLSLSLDRETAPDQPSTYTVLAGSTSFARALRPTAIEGLTLLPSNIDLSGAELELASAIGREFLMRDALREWEREARARDGRAPADYVIFDCPPSLGLLSINALAASGEVLITLQTEFLALQGMSKLVEVVQLLRRRLNPELEITGILPCLYDSRLKLAREVLGEIRTYFPGQVFPNPVRSNVKLAEAPSYGKTIFEYAPDSNGAADYRLVAREMITRESRDPDLAELPPFDDRVVPLASGASEAEAEGVRTKAMLRAASTNGAAEPKRAPARANGTVATPATENARGLEVARAIEPTVITPTVITPTAIAPAVTPAHEAVERPEPDEKTILAPVSAREPVPTEDEIENVPELARSQTPITSAVGALDPELLLLDQRVRERPEPVSFDRLARASALRLDESLSLEEQDSSDPTESLREVVLAPAPRASERRSVRLEELPALPPDAFEILTSYVYEG
jgi:chromosome partitioning protein